MTDYKYPSWWMRRSELDETESEKMCRIRRQQSCGKPNPTDRSSVTDSYTSKQYGDDGSIERIRRTL